MERMADEGNGSQPPIAEGENRDDRTHIQDVDETLKRPALFQTQAVNERFETNLKRLYQVPMHRVITK